jgi:Flp pilus assembly pilin Flp
MRGVDERADRQEDFARDETASSSIETALLLSLMATFVFVVRSSLVGPMLQKFVDAANTLSRALS